MAMVSIVCSYILLFPSMVYLLLRHAQIEIVADVHMQYKANKLFNSSKNQWRTKCRESANVCKQKNLPVNQ